MAALSASLFSSSTSLDEESKSASYFSRKSYCSSQVSESFSIQIHRRTSILEHLNLILATRKRSRFSEHEGSQKEGSLKTQNQQA
jgi:hypothetical protein